MTGLTWEAISRERDASGGDPVVWRALNEALLRRPDLPGRERERAHLDAAHRLPRLADLAVGVQLRLVDVPVREGWFRSNPSLATGADGRLVMNLRSVNYLHDVLGYHVDAPDGIVRTENTLVTLDADLRPVAVVPLQDRAEIPRFPSPVVGWEDLRLFRVGDRWWGLAASRELLPSNTNQVALLRIDDDGTIVEAHRLVFSPDERTEKNWLPIVAAAGPRVFYGSFPTRTLALDLAAGTVEPLTEHEAPAVAVDFRGGAGAVRLADGWLCVVHEVAFHDGEHRIYSHRFVRLDDAWRIVAVSPPWRMIQRGIEFVAGIATLGDDLVLAFGEGDREAWLARLPLAEALTLLQPAADGAFDDLVASAPTPTPTPVATRAEPRPVAPVLDDTLASGPYELVSVTLTGNSAAIIGDAIASVRDLVDAVIVVDTGATDDTIAVARAAAGDKFVLRSWAWRQDFAAARNAALEIAAGLGATWALLLDTDERLHVGAADPRAVLRSTPHAMLTASHVAGNYGKERVFRMPAAGGYVGRTHEAFILAGGSRGDLPGVTFDELPKDSESFRRKCERDVQILREVTAELPNDPRWHYYLGQSHQGLGQHREAIAAFEACAALRGWDDESGWAMYQAATCHITLGELELAVDACARGLALQPGMAELPWLAGWACWKMGRHVRAAHWSRMAIAIGHFAGDGADFPRGGFSEPRGRWEGPFDVLRFALRALGDDAGADHAEELFQRALAARERGDPPATVRGRAIP